MFSVDAGRLGEGVPIVPSLRSTPAVHQVETLIANRKLSGITVAECNVLEAASLDAVDSLVTIT